MHLPVREGDTQRLEANDRGGEGSSRRAKQRTVIHCEEAGETGGESLRPETTTIWGSREHRERNPEEIKAGGERQKEDGRAE